MLLFSLAIGGQKIGPKAAIKLDIVTKAFTYNKGGKYCNICISEALVIFLNQKNVYSLH